MHGSLSGRVRRVNTVTEIKQVPRQGAKTKTRKREEKEVEVDKHAQVE
jgi:hypothetical protein